MNDSGLAKPLEQADEVVERTLKRRLESQSSSDRAAGESPSAAAFRHELDKEKEHHRSDAYFQPKRWWFTATACPLVAGTFGPVASLMSVCALVQSWRLKIPPGGSETAAERVPDPTWLLAVNAVSLVFAIVANLLLLLNFAHRLRYAVAQPLTIIFWYISSLLLVSLAVAAHKHLRLPARDHAFSQSYYYGIISAGVYFIISTLLFWNLLGAYVFKQYPPSFTSLTMSQRTLMLQTISYSLYLSLGAGIFASIEGWSFVDGVYWADYTLLTIGLGSDFPLKKTLSKGLLIPYTAIGIIMIGLVVDSVRVLLLEREKVHRRAIEKERQKLLKKLDLSDYDCKHEFELMRKVQDEAEKRRRWWGLGSSFAAFLVVWLGGAMVFMLSEKPQRWGFFEALYFTYISLLTIGYGDYYPQSNFGKPFFVIWSLIAIPTVTILISTMGSTVVEWVKEGTLWLGRKTILPERHGKASGFLSPATVREEATEEEEQEQEQEQDVEELGVMEDMEQLGHVVQAQAGEKVEEDHGHHHHHLGALIAREISFLSKDIGRKPPKKYEWDAWKRFLELLGEWEEEHDNKWRWLGHSGPLLSGVTETEWILGKMCERLEEVLVKKKDS